MEQIALWCLSSFLFGLGILILMFAFLRAGDNTRYKNKRIAEIVWQSRNQNTDWWLDINKHQDQ